MKYSRVYEESLLSAVSDVKGLDKIKGSTVMVTGATGLIGSAVADLLAAQRMTGSRRRGQSGSWPHAVMKKNSGNVLEVWAITER